MLQVANLNVCYGESHVIRDISLSVAPEESVATSIRAAERGSAGTWAMRSSGRSYAKDAARTVRA